MSSGCCSSAYTTFNFIHLWLSTGVFKDLTQEYILGVLIIIINFNNMFNIKNKERGFTLIELLIVIAIIGVLAATVVVSLGSQTDQAQKGSTKIGVSSIRNLATVAVAENGVTDADGNETALDSAGVCKLIYDQVSGEKADWTWGGNAVASKKTDICNADQSDKVGEVCCSSAEKEWVVWSLLDKSGIPANSPDGTVRPGSIVYCVDSKGFAGEITLVAKDGNGARDTTIIAGNTAKKAVSCQ